MKTKYKLSIVLIIALLLLFPGTVLADELASQFGGDSPLMVPDGYTVESVFALSTDARIAGSVKDVVLVVNGNVYLEPTAQADLVIDIGGQVINPSNVPVKTGIFRLSFTSKFINELFIGLALILGLWFVRLIVSILGIVLLTGLGFLFRNRLQQRTNLLANSPLRLLGIGIAAFLIVLALIVLLSLTIIGIPVAVLILILATGSAILGILPVIEYIGKKIISAQLLESPALSRWFIFALLLVSVLNLPLVGSVVLLGAVFMGLGVSTVTGFVYLKERKHRTQAKK